MAALHAGPLHSGPLHSGPSHQLNNLFCKIIGSAELALDRVQDPLARAELEVIIELTERGADLVRAHPLSESG